MKNSWIIKYGVMVLFVFGLVTQSLAQNTNKDNSGKSLFKRAQPSATITVLADVAAYDENTIGALKDDLSNYHEKIVMIAIDEKGKTLKVIYTEHMLVEDLQKTFNKHGVTKYRN